MRGDRGAPHRLTVLLIQESRLTPTPADGPAHHRNRRELPPAPLLGGDGITATFRRSQTFSEQAVAVTALGIQIQMLTIRDTAFRFWKRIGH